MLFKQVLKKTDARKVNMSLLCFFFFLPYLHVAVSSKTEINEIYSFDLNEEVSFRSPLPSWHGIKPK